MSGINYFFNSVLYVTTSIIGTGCYFANVHYPSIWYYKLQRTVIKRLSGREKPFNFIVSFYPNNSFKNPNVELNIDKATCSLTELLAQKKFDLIITEAFATTLLEILSTKSQVLCFIPEKYTKIYSESLSILQKRAFVARTEDEYLKLIDILINCDTQMKIKLIDDDFLNKFGLGGWHKKRNAITDTKEIFNKILA